VPSRVLHRSRSRSPQPRFPFVSEVYAAQTTHASRTSPSYVEIQSAEALFDTSSVAHDLQAIDWAFEADDTGYSTHDLHPYPAKFIPQIPGHVIARLSLRGELVLDPFAGSGTTGLEAVRLGRRAVCVDANPVGVLAGKVKTTRLDSGILRDLHSIRSSLLTHLRRLPSDPADLVREFTAFVPDIPNRQKWFPDTSCGELALIRSLLSSCESERARNVASLAMSRIVLRASFQDLETRYASRPREIPPGDTIASFIRSLDSIVGDLVQTDAEISYGVAEFILGDARALSRNRFTECCIDLIVTSPPYGNAMDYHLYHRFRLFWLGADPQLLARNEIGSHLRHQKEKSGVASYQAELSRCLAEMYRVLRPGRYAAIVIGDPVYEKQRYDGAHTLSTLGAAQGFGIITVIARPIHRVRRSFLAAGRRATQEHIVVLQKPPRAERLTLLPPTYGLWPYEQVLRSREVHHLTGSSPLGAAEPILVRISPAVRPRLRELAFSSAIRDSNGDQERTWQAVLENGPNGKESNRKDPKYVTHGLHPYKGKFYPQLAKALLNLSDTTTGSVVFDPFCGSGTTLLESYLNGRKALGCDLSPLAAKIASAKVDILQVDPLLVSESVGALVAYLEDPPAAFPDDMEEFIPESREEILAWFPRAVVRKLNWLLRTIRARSAGPIREFYEVLFSRIIRGVSHQEPSDLRIRRRKEPLADADVLAQFRSALGEQYRRLTRFWAIRGYCPSQLLAPAVREGDSRSPSALATLGILPETVDLVLTSPPYATALPYIDTDRLSLLVLFGMTSRERRPLEFGLTGSREISPADRRLLEQRILDRDDSDLPESVTSFVRRLLRATRATETGFRRRNMPALLFRYFHDMHQAFATLRTAMRKNASAMIVMGDNVTTIAERSIPIPTTELMGDIVTHLGFAIAERIPITVTTENLLHIRNAIKRNVVLWIRR
jgi:DNA modification methylase